jgi:hypothetical protein
MSVLENHKEFFRGDFREKNLKSVAFFGAF